MASVVIPVTRTVAALGIMSGLGSYSLKGLQPFLGHVVRQGPPGLQQRPDRALGQGILRGTVRWHVPTDPSQAWAR
jgi:hypothetical protein